MIADLKPYPEYKESGLPWLGEVPAHWSIRRVKYLLHEVDARSTSGKEQLLRVSQFTGVSQRKSMDGSDMPDSRAASLVGYKKVSTNDLVINIMLAWNGSLGVSRYEGIASPAYCVYRFNKDIVPWYYHELLRLPVYKGRIKIASTGVVESRLRLYSDDLGRIEAILPHQDDQVAIVRFLNWANNRLGRAIKAKQKQIALLNEQKQAIIHRAVTRGLDPSVPLKPSGIPWLGDIPAHWEIQRIKYVFKRIVGGSTPASGNPNNWNGDIVWITPADVSKSSFLTKSIRTISNQGMKSCSTELVPADSIILTSRAPVGNVAIAKVPLCTNQGCKALIPAVSKIVPMFGFWCLSVMKDELQSRASGTTFFEISTNKLASVSIPLPKIKEQERILEFITKETDTLNISIEHFEHEIELLHEYRTRLVADVVTGKLDVREAAAKLPEEEIEEIAEASEDMESADEEMAV